MGGLKAQQIVIAFSIGVVIGTFLLLMAIMIGPKLLYWFGSHQVLP